MAASSRPSMTCATPSGPSSPATMPSGWLRRTAIAAPPRCVLPGRRRPSGAPHNAAYCPDSRVRYTKRQERTQWHRVAIFNEKLGEIAEKYLRKGSKVYLEGQIESRKYTDKDGQEREITEVVIGRFKGELTLLDGRGGGEMGEGGGYGGGRSLG